MAVERRLNLTWSSDPGVTTRSPPSLPSSPIAGEKKVVETSVDSDDDVFAQGFKVHDTATCKVLLINKVGHRPMSLVQNITLLSIP
jgi:hypothetical protein